MPSRAHQEYRTSIVLWFIDHGGEPGVAQEVDLFAQAILLLWNLDLEPARTTLAACYAKSPRGAKPWDPVVLLRFVLLSLLVGEPRVNKWVPRCRASRLLPVLAGIDVTHRSTPGVGTCYDLFHRLHDGQAHACEHQERPSVQERREAETPRPREDKPEPSLEEGKRRLVTQRLVDHLATTEEAGDPDDLLGRLGAILWDVGVIRSADLGLLGDPAELVAGGDGSPLRTWASGQGREVCDCDESTRCDCPRLFSDPDARWGYDSSRKCYFFGHHFYELSTSSGAHDLPLALCLDPGNETDFTASLRCLDRLRKMTRRCGLDWKVAIGIFDAGHDARPIYKSLLDHGTTPVIPLSQDAPAHHPHRLDLALSRRGVPLCQADVEMTPWGSAGQDRKIFVCPVKAGWRDLCLLADVEKDPQWVCRPEQKLGPTVSVRVSDDPLLFPPIPCNSDRHVELYKLRSGTERSNSVKKEVFELEAAHHRRSSFWLIRLHLIALLQHAKAWVSGLDDEVLVSGLLAGQEVATAA